MSPENWTDLFATIRYVFGTFPNIIAAVGAVLAAWKGFTTTTHLQKQDVVITDINTKVDTIAPNPGPGPAVAMSDLGPVRLGPDASS